MTMKKRMLKLAVFAFAIALCGCAGQGNDDKKCGGYVRKSPDNCRYFSTTTGETYIPVGMNICFPRFIKDPDEALADYEKKFRTLSENGGNYARIWLSHPLFEIEDTKQGEFNPEKIARVDRLFDLADKYGIRLKLCFENFTSLYMEKSFFTFSSAPPFDKRIYHKKFGGDFETMDEFFGTQHGRDVYLARVKVFADRYKDRKCVFAWELWNESSCVNIGKNKLGVLKDWHSYMLKRLHKMFPNHMVVISMPSYDNNDVRNNAYPALTPDPDNDVAQVHNYLNEGHALPVAQSPTDIMCADAVNSMLALTPDRPVLFAEVGATEPNHAGGPSRYYGRDKDGILLTDHAVLSRFGGQRDVVALGILRREKQSLENFRAFLEGDCGVGPDCRRFQAQVFRNPEYESLRSRRQKDARSLLSRQKQFVAYRTEGGHRPQSARARTSAFRQARRFRGQGFRLSAVRRRGDVGEVFGQRNSSARLSPLGGCENREVGRLHIDKKAKGFAALCFFLRPTFFGKSISTGAP